jgi:eukaryotic-like serine/threonine-protein kinase
VTANRWKEVEAVFEQALELPACERTAFVQQNCNADEELCREVESLLESHASAGRFIDERGLFISDEDLNAQEEAGSVGQVIGAYRIVREIGRGGMGAVYLAERADEQYKKEVAIKLIKRGMDTHAVLRHFRNERQILAGFDHPNIARLFDGGTTTDGLPYFVMEYVEGLPINEYCAAHKLSLLQRLELFGEVCAAVSYAHRHTVIHRDLKMSNILVTSDGTPKLLDFGIAKILQPGAGAEVLMTMTGLRPMTPEYASPEQVRGEPVTTASDVYSLGVILYELLTGQSPYDFVTRSAREIEKAITEQEPTRPSTVAASNSQPPELSSHKLLRGDLDNIVLMALRKEPERRYQSVEQFAEDIVRHLENRPVLARRDTAGYRAWKFLGRNKVGVAAAVLVTLSLVAGLTATSWEARQAKLEKARAERRFNDVRRLAHSVLFDYHDAIKDLPGATHARERLVKDALTYLDSLSREAAGDPSLQRELAAAYERVGDVRGEAFSASLGDTRGALDSYFKSLSIREALVAAAPDDAQNRRDLASSYMRFGEAVQQIGDPGRAFDYLQKALSLYAGIAAEQPKNLQAREDLAAVYNDLGTVLENRGDWAGCLQYHQKAIQLREELVAANSRDPDTRRALSVSYCNAGRALYLSGRFGEAIALNGKAIDLVAALVAEDPTNAHHRRNLAIYYQNDGDYHAQAGEIKSALESFGKKLELDEQALKADPDNGQAQDDYAYSCERIGILLGQLGNYSESLSRLEQSQKIREQTAARDPQRIVGRYNVIGGLSEVALTEAKLGKRAAALAHCGKARHLLEESSPAPDNLDLRVSEAQAYSWLGRTQVQLAATASPMEAERYWSDGRDMFQRALSIWKDIRDHGALAPDDAPNLDEAVRETAKCDAALAAKKSNQW